MIFQAPGTVQSIRTLADGSIKLDVVTQELNPDDMAKLFGLRGKLGWFLLKETEIGAEEIPTHEIKVEGYNKDRTPSQKLRGTMRVFWEQQTNQAEDFDTQWYPRQMELMRQRFLEKLQ